MVSRSRKCTVLIRRMEGNKKKSSQDGRVLRYSYHGSASQGHTFSFRQSQISCHVELPFRRGTDRLPPEGPQAPGLKSLGFEQDGHVIIAFAKDCSGWVTGQASG